MDQMPELQAFPRGSLLIMSAGILMVLSLVFVLIVISHALSFLFSREVVTLIILGLIPFMAIAVTAPGFLITRGKSRWQKVIEIENGIAMVILLTGMVWSLVAGDVKITLVSAIGLALVMGARVCYRSPRYQDGLEYYHRIWTIYRRS